MIPSYKYAHKTQATVYQDNYYSQHEIKQNVLIALSRMLCFLKSPRQHSTWIALCVEFNSYNFNKFKVRSIKKFYVTLNLQTMKW